MNPNSLRHLTNPRTQNAATKSNRITFAQRNPSPQLGASSNGDSLLEDDDEMGNFDLQNQVFQLKSKLNELQLEKTKIEMSYEATIKQLKKKYDTLERIMAERSQKEQFDSRDIRVQCQILIEENQQLKKQLQQTHQKNRMTPNFNSVQGQQQYEVLQQLLQKQQKILQLQQQLKKLQKNQGTQLRNSRVAFLQQENQQLRKQSKRIQKEKEEFMKVMTKQTQDHHNSLIKHKDKKIEDLKKEKISLTLKLQQINRTVVQLKENQNKITSGRSDKQLTAINSQLKNKQLQIADLQQQISVLKMQNQRMKQDKNKYEQKISILDKERKDQLQKKKQLQQEIYRKDCQLSQAKSATFSDKIQAKKQVNIMRLQLEQEKQKLNALIDEKTKENQKYRQTILSLNDENDELRATVSKFKIQNQRFQRQTQSLKVQNQKLNSELKHLLLTKTVYQESNFNSGTQINNSQVLVLKNKLSQLLEDLDQRDKVISQQKQKRIALEKQILAKEQLIELLGIQKNQKQSQMKIKNNSINQYKQSQISKNKVIQKLQDDIKGLKQDAKQLEQVNNQLIEQMQTLKNVHTDVLALRQQLQKQKKYFENRNIQEGKLRINDFKLQLKKGQDQLDSHRNKDMVRSRQQKSISEQDIDKMQKEVQQIVKVNQKLQQKLGQAQSQIDRRGFDLKVKQQQIKTLKASAIAVPKPNLDPMVEANKRIQFNSVVLQNKILQLEKQITSIRQMKTKQLQQYKKKCKKSLQQKYGEQIKRANLYIGELKKKLHLLTQKQQKYKYDEQKMVKKISQLQKQNYQTKYEYSQNLEELNILLQKYKKNEMYIKQIQQSNSGLKNECMSMSKECQRLRHTYKDNIGMLNNANQQIKKLNFILMNKQSQIQGYHSQYNARSLRNSIPTNDHARHIHSFYEPARNNGLISQPVRQSTVINNLNRSPSPYGNHPRSNNPFSQQVRNSNPYIDQATHMQTVQSEYVQVTNTRRWPDRGPVITRI